MFATKLTCILALAQSWPIAMSVYAHGDHLRPIPGEVQSMRWSVHNDGMDRIDRVRIRIRPPADWILLSAPACVHDGTLLSCTLGPLASGQWASADVRMAVPRNPQLGPTRITGRTALAIHGADLSGPTASLAVTVVKHR